jgi:8-oxo-dGTP pyrophosphatase MutT (NUDIX family)
LSVASNNGLRLTFFNAMQPEQLKQIFSEELPGLKSHLKMAPEHREVELLAMKDNEYNPRLSAVLIIFFLEDNRLKMVFIRRSEYVGIHSGQIAFPGGRYEDTDIDFRFTALREVEEEIGIKADSIEILGQLSDLYVPPSNFLMKVFVGYTNERPEYIIDTREVKEVLEFALDDFWAADVVKMKDFKAHNIDRIIKAPYYDINGAIIWGATAMVLTELLDMLNQSIFDKIL